MINDSIFQDFIYRYRSFNSYSIDALKNDRLYFSTPSYFNDPFDSVIYIDEERLLHSILRDMDNGMASYLDSIADTDGTLVTSDNKNQVLTLTQNTDFRLLQLKRVSKIINDTQEKLLSNSKAICFSEDPLSMLMWSHYADYHKGFVLAYRKSELPHAKCYDVNGIEHSTILKLGKIRYRDQMPDFGEFFYDYLPKKVKGFPPSLYTRFLLQMIFNKTIVWNYEKEWRLCSIPEDYSNENPVSYASIRPYCIFLGAKMPAKQKWELFCIAKKMDIAVFEVWANNRSADFKLNFQGVNSRELKQEANEY